MNLGAYLARIHFAGTPRADLDTLSQLARRHAAAIPFENLSPLCGEPVSLALPDIEDKLVERRRGGYCFEHNGLLAAALREIGFDVHPLAARVLWNRPPGSVSPRGHMLLKVGEHLVDVGFGGLTLTGVLQLVDGVPQATPHEPFRVLRQDDGAWRMEAQLRGEWKALYAFDLQRQEAVDYELPNYFLSTHPQSHFVHRLMCARALPDRRLALADRQFTVHRVGGESEVRRVEDTEELVGLLKEAFGIELPSGTAWRERLERLER